MTKDSPRTTRTQNTIRRDTLPEHLRSATVGAIVAEALDNAVHRDEVYAGATGSLVSTAANEIRDWHKIPHPEDVPRENLTYGFARGPAPESRDELGASGGRVSGGPE